MKNLSAIFFVLLLAGCVGTSSLQKSLEERKTPLQYRYDSSSVAEKPGGTISVRSFTVDDLLGPDTVARKESSSALPLIVYNSWEREDMVSLGYGQIENDYKQFLKESFIEELKRSGRFAVRGEGGDVALDIRVTKIRMFAPISQRGHILCLVFFLGVGSDMVAGPVDVAVTADVRATRGSEVLINHPFQGNFRTGMMSVRGSRLKEFTPVMIRSLSFAVKDLNEKIVREINQL